jgi:hypothetical protein
MATLAGGANLGGKAALLSQRVEDNAFHLSKIALWVVEHTTNGQQAEFFVVLADQADLTAAANCRRKPRRGVSCIALC